MACGSKLIFWEMAQCLFGRLTFIVDCSVLILLPLHQSVDLRLGHLLSCREARDIQSFSNSQTRKHARSVQGKDPIIFTAGGPSDFREGQE